MRQELLPLKITARVVEVTLQTAPGGSYAIYTLDTAGRRTGEIPFTRIDARTIRFPAKVFGPHGTTLAYELVRR